ncbi:MAG: ORF6N domain-containing protein [PVC group bacterium]
MNKKESMILSERIMNLIFTIRGTKVIIDTDLAALYGVQTKVLNQAVKRNNERFPDSFMFKLTKKEAKELFSLRSQNVTLKRGQHLKYLPYAFTEHGALMSANVLRSQQAISISIQVIEAFIRMRKMLISYDDLARKLKEMEKKYDSQFRVVFEAIRQLMTPPDPPRRKIGFQTREE